MATWAGGWIAGESSREANCGEQPADGQNLCPESEESLHEVESLNWL